VLTAVPEDSLTRRAWRMEFAGIAAGVTFAMTHYADIQLLPWYCDSNSAVGEIPKLHGRTTNQWLAAPNTTSATTFQTFPHKRSAALRYSVAVATLNGGWIPSNMYIRNARPHECGMRRTRISCPTPPIGYRLSVRAQ
jgi:hypothetical protein